MTGQMKYERYITIVSRLLSISLPPLTVPMKIGKAILYVYSRIEDVQPWAKRIRCVRRGIKQDIYASHI